MLVQHDKSVLAQPFTANGKVYGGVVFADSHRPFLLAAVCASGILPFGLSVFEEALRKFLPAKILDVNLRALEIGESILAGK